MCQYGRAIQIERGNGGEYFLKAKGSDNIAHATAIQKGFEETMQQYQKAQVKYRTQMRKQLARQYQIINPNATQEDIEKAQEKGDQFIFSTATLETRMGQESLHSKDFHSRNRDIRKIEQSMEELAEVSEKLSKLIYAQDISIEEGGDKAQKVVVDVEAGADKLGTASNHAEKTRKNRWWLLIVALIITLTISFAAILTIKPWE
ncbi:Plasma membrane t-SNARE, secretory vesicle fusion [Arthrobotrys musiformis]|uniref:Plasma membrane t-SNARE, secretory vesicle fusion n=1 Tax=Arthrobotrys musiformis TaxID=47236 RepID=A0AAV9VT09_9PEZI